MALPHESVDDEASVDDGVILMSEEEARAYFDTQTRQLVGMSGEEFVRRLDAGEWEDVIDDGEHNDYIWLAMMRRSLVG